MLPTSIGIVRLENALDQLVDCLIDSLDAVALAVLDQLVVGDASLARLGGCYGAEVVCGDFVAYVIVFGGGYNITKS